MQKTATPVDSYIKSIPENYQESVAALDKIISKEFKGLTRVMWEGVFWGGSEQKIIGYGDLTMVGSSKKPVDWFVLGLTAQKNYIAVHVVVIQDKKYLLENYVSKLGKVKGSKSAFNFQNIEDLNMDTFKEIVKSAAKYAKEQSKK